MLRVDQTFIRNQNIETAEMGEEVGMLNVETGKYYILNGIGADIWAALENEMNLVQLIDHLMGMYDVERDLCEAQTKAFLEELIENGLVK